MTANYRHSFEQGFIKAAFETAGVAEDAGRFFLRYGDDLTEMVARYQMAKKREQENNQKPIKAKPITHA